MARSARKPVEIASLDDLRRVLQDVSEQNTSRIIQISDDVRAVLSPIPTANARRKQEGRGRIQTDDEAFLSAAGSWKGLIDPDEFMKQVREGRSSNRPPIVLDLPDE